MAENSKIEWTDHTWNPWVGCTKISPACDHCYAEGWAKRSGLVKWGGERRRTSAANWRKPIKWNKDAKVSGTWPRVFCASLADVFDNKVPAEWRADMWQLIKNTRHLDWLLLTKRPQNIDAMLPEAWRIPPIEYGHVWFGTTVENQAEANRRIPHLRAVPAAVRFLSCEPLLEEVRVDLTGIDWVITGSESGSGARPTNPDWVRSLRDQCAAERVPFFYKQKVDGGRKTSLPELDGRRHDAVPSIHIPV